VALLAERLIGKVGFGIVGNEMKRKKKRGRDGCWSLLGSILSPIIINK